MTLNLVMGVIEKPYAHGGQTTGDVAEILEAKYHPMETFFERNEEELTGYFVEAAEGALETLLMGGPSHALSWAEATEKVEARFRLALDTKEFDSYGIKGVPTKASRGAKSLRFKRKVNPSGTRPSFVDTGAYENSFKAWVVKE